MPAALDRVSVAGLFTHWTVQPLGIALVVVLALWYARGVHRLRTGPVPVVWPAWRTGVFGLGLLLTAWLTNGSPQVYGRALYWVWTSQILALWLLVPVIVLLGRPVQLAQAVNPAGGLTQRVLRSRVVRTLGNPLIGPALVPVLSALLFFGPVAGWSIRDAAVGWVVQLIMIGFGAVMAVPLVGLEETATSLAVGLSVAIGIVELVLDAIPGIVLRLSNGLETTFFDHRLTLAWSPSPLHDQQTAAAVLWGVAEMLDLPFLFLVFRRWLRADARDAARIDAVLAAERAARAGMTDVAHDGAEGAGAPEPQRVPSDRDVPWWLSDPEMQRRLRNQR